MRELGRLPPPETGVEQKQTREPAGNPGDSRQRGKRQCRRLPSTAAADTEIPVTPHEDRFRVLCGGSPGSLYCKDALINPRTRRACPSKRIKKKSIHNAQERVSISLPLSLETKGKEITTLSCFMKEGTRPAKPLIAGIAASQSCKGVPAPAIAQRALLSKERNRRMNETKLSEIYAAATGLRFENLRAFDRMIDRFLSDPREEVLDDILKKVMFLRAREVYY